ncbi:MAG: YlxR family protein [Eubacteriales bacterium]|jgi:predicted RNA-binding protein YlxR (DUF448 family)|nr:YlxR family protein [Eubacteriales bacterium]MDD4104714.1 YlxR family protein [Eubacteriales bacterium]MDD4710294.1 YlxR family protein [Eubacteriales bacterium]
MPKKIPMRMCVGCREMRPKKELIRIVRSPEGEISIDMKGKKSGRGAYICYNEQCLARALKQKQLDRALECAISGDIAQTLTDSIKKARPSDD